MSGTEAQSDTAGYARPAGQAVEAADAESAAGGIVVGVDGSPASVAAIRWACDEAARRLVPVIAVLVWDVMGEPRPVFETAANADREGLAHAATRVLDTALTAARVSDPTVRIIRRVEEGSPVPELLRAAADARMIVVGERGHGALHRLVSGSVSQGVVHHASLPVVVVRPVAPAAGSGRHRSGKHDRDMASGGAHQPVGIDDRPVVVGVDGSAPSLTALRWAVEAAMLRKSALHVVHAWHLDIPIYPGSYADIGSALAEQARQTLDQAVSTIVTEHAGGLPIPVRKETVVDGPAHALLRASADAQLLVVGSRGHGGFAELLLGSVSHQCVLHAHCPVAVVR
ncbi:MULTISPECIES: universal stress protein [unclassified Frankia]